MLASPRKTTLGIASLRRAALLALAMAAARMSFVLLLPLAMSPTAVFAAFAINLVGYILGIAALGFFSLGLWRMNSGRDEHGSEHRRQVERAVRLTSLALVLFALGYLLPLLPVALTLSAARGGVVGLVFVVAAESFMAPRHRTIGLCGAVALAASTPVQYGAFLLAIGTWSLTAAVFLLAAVGGAIELVGYGLLYAIYPVARDRLEPGADVTGLDRSHAAEVPRPENPSSAPGAHREPPPGG